MRLSRLAALIVAAGVAGGTHALAHVVEGPPEQTRTQFREPLEIIEIYLRAVDRGELVVFERKFNKSMLVPVSVEYVYELESATSRVKVYSELKEPVPVPGQEDCKLRGVSAILDERGRILETEAHIWPE